MELKQILWRVVDEIWGLSGVTTKKLFQVHGAPIPAQSKSPSWTAHSQPFISPNLPSPPLSQTTIKGGGCFVYQEAFGSNRLRFFFPGPCSRINPGKRLSAKTRRTGSILYTTRLHAIYTDQPFKSLSALLETHTYTPTSLAYSFSTPSLPAFIANLNRIRYITQFIASSTTTPHPPYHFPS